MAGQQAQSFRPEDLPQQNNTAAPSVTTTAEQFTAGHVDASGQASAFQSLGNAFGGFFKNLSNATQNVGDTIQQARLTQIQRENEALAKQGQADFAAGKAPDEQANTRESYHSAYQQSFAQNQAGEMNQELAARLRDMPQDGSVNPEDIAKQVAKDFYGSGTGDVDFDSALAGRYAPAAQAMVAQKQEQIAQTQEQNQTLEIQNAAYTQINSPEGISAAGMATIESRYNAVTHGNQALTDKWMGTLIGGVRNKTQALAVLNGLYSNGFAARNPVEYQRMSQEAVQQIQTVKSIQAAQEVDDIRMQAYALRANPQATVADWAQLMYNAQRTDANHGVGMDKFGEVFTGFQAAAKQKATINAMGLAARGYQGSHDINTVATLLGEAPADAVKKSWEGYMADPQYGLTPDRFPALFASKQSNAGLPDALASDQAGQEFVQYVTAPGNRDYSGGTMPPRIQADIQQALVSGDSDRAARAWRVLDQIHNQVGDHAFGNYLGDNQEAAGLYWGVKALAPTNGDVSQVYKKLRDGGYDARTLEKVGNGGSINWEPLLPGKKQADVDTAVDKAMGKAMLSDVGRTGLVWNPGVSMSTDDRQSFNGLVLQQLMAQKANGTVNLDSAITNAAKFFKGSRMATIGRDGTVKVIPDAFNGRGRTTVDAINASPDAPFSVTKGYAPIYSSFPMTNAAGEQEDPFKTAQGDLKDLPSKFPGMGLDSGLSLARPDATGLSEIRTSDDNPIILHAGQKLTVRQAAAPQTDAVLDSTPLSWENPNINRDTGAGKEIAGEIPADPKAAATFFKNNLPPGVFAVYDQTHNQYTLNYAYRLKVSLADAERIRAQRSAQYQQDAAQREAIRKANANPLFVR